MIVIGITKTHIDFIGEYDGKKFKDVCRIVDVKTPRGIVCICQPFRSVTFSVKPNGERKKFFLKEDSVLSYEELETADIIDDIKTRLTMEYEFFRKTENYDMADTSLDDSEEI